MFGNEYKLCLNLFIDFKDEKEKNLNIETDKSWKVKISKQVSNNIYVGEEIDYTLPESSPEGEDVIKNEEKYNITPDFGNLIVEKNIKSRIIYITKRPKGEQILDFKQNMVGFIRYKGALNKNQELKISHGKVLQKGNFYNLNYRIARVILKQKGDGKKGFMSLNLLIMDLDMH